MDRGRPTRLSSKSGCGAGRRVWLAARSAWGRAKTSWLAEATHSCLIKNLSGLYSWFLGGDV